ncbi:MAG: hypothetical protein JXB60_03955, partial [Candidatus Cloacimonetes bacterium]|nr:hypothetical protein [Candidatus Cloacimonadota bacterium]
MKKAILTCLLVFLVSLAFAGIELQSNPKSQLSSFNEKHPNISSNRELYWDQISNPSGDGVIAAQDFINPTNDPYDCWGADDFEVG